MEKEELLQLVESEFGPGCAAICRERWDQLNKHKWTLELNTNQQLRQAANRLTDFLMDHHPPPANWAVERWTKLKNKIYPDRMAASGAFLAAEYDRTFDKEKFKNQN